MYLKEIEIQGFKSFADKTKVVFDQGVTAVVGPNGSGKSNITESLRMGLGEIQCQEPSWWQDARCHFCWDRKSQTTQLCFCCRDLG